MIEKYYRNLRSFLLVKIFIYYIEFFVNLCILTLLGLYR